MARRKARKTTRRTVRRGTRRGQVRKTARRAYMPAPKRRRSNPKPITSTPAFRYAAWAVGGSATEVVLNQTGFLAKTIKDRLMRSAAYAALTIMVGRMVLKGRARENALALGIGMLIPGVSNYVGSMDLGSQFKWGANGNGNGAAIGNGNGSAAAIGNGNGNVDGTNGLATGSRTLALMRAATNPYSTANTHAARTSGLTAIK